jgi:hypothetical protein
LCLKTFGLEHDAERGENVAIVIDQRNHWNVFDPPSTLLPLAWRQCTLTCARRPADRVKTESSFWRADGGRTKVAYVSRNPQGAALSRERDVLSN